MSVFVVFDISLDLSVPSSDHAHRAADAMRRLISSSMQSSRVTVEPRYLNASTASIKKLPNSI